MKILMPVLHYSPVIGGFEVFIKNICDRLSTKAEIFVITGKVIKQPKEEIKNGLKIIRKASLYPLKDYSYTSYWYLFTMLPFLFFFSLRTIKREKIDFVHAQGFLSGVVAWLLYKFVKTPYIITIQSADFNIYHSEVKFNFLISLQSWIEKKVYRDAKVCHAVSNDLVKHFERQGRSITVMIPNGVETNIFKILSQSEKEKIRQELGTKEKFVISCVSRLQEKNGTHDLISAVALLKDKNVSVECWIIGDGQERVRLEKLVDELGVRDRVKFLGQILHEDAGKFVGASDIFVRPSLAEGFGIVYLEAMACGIPVIGTPVGGIIDFLHDEETGILSKVSCPEDLANKIEVLLDNPELKNKLLENSFKMIKENYSWDSVANRVFELYKV